MFSFTRRMLSKVRPNLTTGQLIKSRTLSTTKIQFQGEPKLYRTPTIRTLLAGPSKRIGLAFILASTLTGISLLAWQGTHWYVENYMHATSPELDDEIRSYLRGAYLRENIQPDLAMVELYLIKAMELVDKKEKDGLIISDVTKSDILIRLGRNFRARKKHQQGIDSLLKAYHTLISSNDNNQIKLIMLYQIGLELGKLYLDLDQLDLSEVYLIKSFKLLSTTKDKLIINQKKDDEIILFKDYMLNDIELNKLSVDYRITLSGVYAKSNQLDNAIRLLKDTLIDIEKYKPTNSQENVLHPWGSIEPLVYYYLSELTYATTQSTEQSLALAWKAYHLVQPFINRTVDAELVTSSILTTLGQLYSKENDWDQAKACFAQAVQIAQSVGEISAVNKPAKLLAELQLEDTKPEN